MSSAGTLATAALGLRLIDKPKTSPLVQELDVRTTGLRHRLSFEVPRKLDRVVLPPLRDLVLARAVEGRPLTSDGRATGETLGILISGLAIGATCVRTGARAPDGARAISILMDEIRGDPRQALVRDIARQLGSEIDANPQRGRPRPHATDAGRGDRVPTDSGNLSPRRAELESHVAALEQQATMLRTYLNHCDQERCTQPATAANQVHRKHNDGMKLRFKDLIP